MATFKKVLFIDDDLITVKICERMIKLVDFAEEFISCEDGKQAIDYLNRHSQSLPDIIFVDLNMSVMNGWEFVKWFSESGPSQAGIPLYVLSSSLYQEDYDKINMYKTAGSIVKPIDVDILEYIANKHSA